MSRALKTAAFGALARSAKALAHPHRFELLHLLEQSPRDVDTLARGSERTVASTSQHLQVLARAHLVTRSREGTRVVYALAPGVADLLQHLEAVALARDPELRMVREDWLADHPAVALAPLAEVDGLVATGDAVLIDVRPEAEFAHGHRPGARSVPLPQLAHRMAELPLDREIVAVCRGRWCTWADEAVEALVAAGFRARRLDG